MNTFETGLNNSQIGFAIEFQTVCYKRYVKIASIVVHTPPATVSSNNLHARLTCALDVTLEPRILMSAVDNARIAHPEQQHIQLGPFVYRLGQVVLPRQVRDDVCRERVER